LVIPSIGSTLPKQADGKPIDGKIKWIGRQGIRHKQLLDDLKEIRQY